MKNINEKIICRNNGMGAYYIQAFIHQMILLEKTRIEKQFSTSL